MMDKVKYSYENLVIKKDLIKLREKWKRLLRANVVLNITYNEQTGILKFNIMVKE